jgi:hypothetical protein
MAKVPMKACMLQIAQMQYLDSTLQLVWLEALNEKQPLEHCPLVRRVRQSRRWLLPGFSNCGVLLPCL